MTFVMPLLMEAPSSLIRTLFNLSDQYEAPIISIHITEIWYINNKYNEPVYDPLRLIPINHYKSSIHPVIIGHE